MDDVELLARMVQCEAGGEGDNGMKAVASVIMNRVRITYGEDDPLAGGIPSGAVQLRNNHAGRRIQSAEPL